MANWSSYPKSTSDRSSAQDLSDGTGAALSLELIIPHNGSKILLSILPAVPTNHEVFQPGRWERPAFGAWPSKPLIGSFLASPARADRSGEVFFIEFEMCFL